MYVVIQYEASSIVATTLEEVESLWKRELVKEGPMADIESRVSTGLQKKKYHMKNLINVFILHMHTRT